MSAAKIQAENKLLKIYTYTVSINRGRLESIQRVAKLKKTTRQQNTGCPAQCHTTSTKHPRWILCSCNIKPYPQSFSRRCGCSTHTTCLIDEGNLIWALEQGNSYLLKLNE